MSMLSLKAPNGRYRAASPEEVFAEAARLRSELFLRQRNLCSPVEVREFLTEQLAHRHHEAFCCLFLDTRHRLITYEELFQGTVDGAIVYPRVVVKRVLQLNATAVIVAHNHPSGVAEPSEADRSITARLTKALQLIDVRLLDHLIIAGDSQISLAERGWI